MSEGPFQNYALLDARERKALQRGRTSESDQSGVEPRCGSLSAENEAGELCSHARLRPGMLAEFSGRLGTGKSEWALHYLAKNPEHRAAWIEDSLTAYPRAFPQNGVELDRILFIEAGPYAQWCALQCLKSQIFQVVVLRSDFDRGHRERIVQLRRLQLAAEKSHAVVILLPEEPTREGRWPIAVQLQAGGLPNGTARNHARDRLHLFSNPSPEPRKTG